ncbi:MAG: 1-acyl-sn-glycerol-3-phosphate acyltransferase [Bacteroidales bacterium]|nr:1-acyl-sn-glycerol-3-phosphate acyltransferase [Bacteroidales bacterium]
MEIIRTMKKFCLFVLKLMRFKIDTVNVPKEAKKCVLLFAPHTSMYDFVVGRFALTAMGVRSFFLIKKEVFWFPLGNLLRALGGIPLDRQHVRDFNKFTKELFEKNDEMALLISPEGTRKKVTNWKKGFYHIVQNTGVPLVLGYLDYRSRRGGISGVFHVTGDYEADIEEIKKNYYGMQGKHLGQFDLEDLPYVHPDWLDNK